MSFTPCTETEGARTPQGWFSYRPLWCALSTECVPQTSIAQVNRNRKTPQTLLHHCHFLLCSCHFSLSLGSLLDQESLLVFSSWDTLFPISDDCTFLSSYQPPGIAEAVSASYVCIMLVNLGRLAANTSVYLIWRALGSFQNTLT